MFSLIWIRSLWWTWESMASDLKVCDCICQWHYWNTSSIGRQPLTHTHTLTTTTTKYQKQHISRNTWSLSTHTHHCTIKYTDIYGVRREGGRVDCAVSTQPVLFFPHPLSHSSFFLFILCVFCNLFFLMINDMTPLYHSLCFSMLRLGVSQIYSPSTDKQY